MDFRVHIPKNISFTPISLKNFECHTDDSDFLQDPDQLCDVLPQPYRMVNKIVENLYSDTWEIIREKEEREFISRNKLRPPKYECSVICDLAGRVPLCLVSSADGQYIFASTNDAVMAISSETYEVISHLDDPGVEITSMKCISMPLSVHLIFSIDDLGVARIYAFSNKRFSILKIFSEQDSTVKVQTTMCEASPKADYLGLTNEYSASGECHVDIYKLPLDVWNKELESLAAQLQKQRASLIQELLDSQQSESPGRDGQDVDPSYIKAPTVASNHPNLVAIERAYRYTSPTLTLKIKPPTKLTACASSNIAGMLKAADTGDILGQGAAHAYTQHHIDQRKNVFNYLHRDLLDYLPSEEEEIISQPTIHFLNQGRMTVSVDPTVSEDSASSVIVWWTGSHFLYNYSLIKFPAKDLEQKADLVVPLSRCVLCSATSPCTSLLALGLSNGAIVLWDWHTGIEKGVANLGNEQSIDCIQFINRGMQRQAISTDDLNLSAPVLLLVLSNKSILSLVSFGAGNGHIEIINVCDSLSDDNSQRITNIQVLTALPNVVLRVERNGVLYLQDIINNSLLCEIALPQTHEMTSPWDPVLALGDGGRMLYIHGTALVKASNSDANADQDQVESNASPAAQTAKPSSGHSRSPSHDDVGHPRIIADQLFVCQLRSFPCLDDHWSHPANLETFVSHYTAKQRVDTYMKNRLVEQGERKVRMQERWGQLHKDLINRALSVDVASLKQTLSSPTQPDFHPKPGTQMRK